jgi:hypothetical protein
MRRRLAYGAAIDRSRQKLGFKDDSYEAVERRGLVVYINPQNRHFAPWFANFSRSHGITGVADDA